MLYLFIVTAIAIVLLSLMGFNLAHELLEERQQRERDIEEMYRYSGGDMFSAYRKEV